MTPYELRFQNKFPGPIWPFGIEVEYKPSSPVVKNQMHPFGGDLLPGIFMGYRQQCGGGYDGVMFVVDWEDMGNATTASQIQPRKIAEECVFPKMYNGKYRFPLKEGVLNQPLAPTFGPKDRNRQGRAVEWKKIVDEDSTDVPEDEEEFEEEIEEEEPSDLASDSGGRIDDGDLEQLEDDPDLKDYWTLTNEVLVIHHLKPRTRLFVPSETTLPIPLEYIDVTRMTITDLDSEEFVIEDVWYDNPDAGRQLSHRRKGRTRFNLLQPKPDPGMEWQNGRLAKIQHTTRPENVSVDEWPRYGKKDRKLAIEKWKEMEPIVTAARKKRKLVEIPESKVKDFRKCIKDAQRQMEIPPAPAMPLKEIETSSDAPKGAEALILGSAQKRFQEDVTGVVPELNINTPKIRKGHNKVKRGNFEDIPDQAKENLAPKGKVSDEWFALVHKPIPIHQAMKIPDAAKAIQKEWDELKDPIRPTWLVKTVKRKSEVIAEARKKGETIHLGSLMCLCHLKNAQLSEDCWCYKGRIVFRGDNVRDEFGHFAVFSEQGTSASHLMAARVVDAIAHMPGMDGEDSDATGAYTQTDLGPDCPPTWITLPKDQWEPEWHKIFTDPEDPPVCRLVKNLYGHPLAGLYWENVCKKGIYACGFEKVIGWECLYKHKKKGLLLSVYVGDLKMGGIAANIAPMWAVLKQHLQLDPAVKLENNVYLGMRQTPCEIPNELIEEKQKMFHELTKQTNPNQKTRKSQYPIKGYQYDLIGNIDECVKQYCSLTKTREQHIKIYPTQCLDDSQLKLEEMEAKGELSNDAAKIVLKIMWPARLTRGDSIWTTNDLARNVTKWSVACDERLQRVIGYLKGTKDYAQYAFVGDLPHECKLMHFVDASFAGDLKDSKSTTGGILFLVGPNTCVPLSHSVKKQGAVSHSSTEAEIISMDANMRVDGLPALNLWEQVIDVFDKFIPEQDRPDEPKGSKKILKSTKSNKQAPS